MIRLDERLSAVAGFVREGSVLADIGSDHGYLACCLVLEGTCPKAYACDINEGPLLKTRRTISEYSLSGKVTAVLSDGLSALKGIVLDDIAIGGRGGELIAEIIGGDAPRPDTTRYILQPMTKAERLRIWLCENGYSIECEKAACAGRFSYPVMLVKYTGEKYSPSQLFAWTGKIWDNSDDSSLDYLRRVRNRLSNMAKGDPRLAALEAEIAAAIDERIGGK